MKKVKPKILRITTVPVSLKYLLKGQFSFFKEKGFEVHIASSDGVEGFDVQENEQVTFHVIPLTRAITPFRDLYSIFLLFKFLKRENFDIVHSHTPKAGLIAMIAAWLARVPVRLHTVAGLPLMESKGLKKKVLISVERLTYKLATKVYPNSNALGVYINSEIYSNPFKLKVLANGSSNGIDLNHFIETDALKNQSLEIREALNIGSNAKVGIFIGRLVGDKGVNELIQASADVIASGNNFHLILVGSFENELDPLKPETKARINELSRIHVAGFQSDVRPYLLASDFLVFPSYREGFPNVPLQAGAMGLPAIVSDINGCNEIIIDEHNGLIIPPKNAVSLRDAIKRLLNDEALTHSLKRNARKSIEDRFDRTLVWEAILSEYNDQLNEHLH
ncbi:glycosyltransferase family 4 protein [Roseivirga echinicomitans]